LKAWVRALELTAPITKHPAVTLPTLIDDLADRFGASDALASNESRLSYRALAQQANRYARWALDQGLGRGDVVCLVMRNCPEYMAIWLGITRTGAVVALVNTNLVGDSLAHAIRIVAPRHVIVGADLADAVADAMPRLARAVPWSVHGPGAAGLPRIDDAIATASGDPLTKAECPTPSIADRALYIYTSGTTGLPKAANVSHHRVMQWSHWFAGMLDTKAADRMYDCLPMYHSIGGIVATGAMLVNGGSVVIRQRFSARDFWDDIEVSDCTLFQYIGELCRFLVNSPPHPLEREHHIRICCGNGMGAGVWREFQERFRIPRILEFYAATEANFSLYNCEGKPGAIGRIPPFLAHRFPVALVKFDDVAGAPVRDADGFCTRCDVNEIGEAISKIVDDGSAPQSKFDGYSDAEASAKKVLRNVFVLGDAWFRTGDLMRKDGEGFFYFVDRIGDTFRWKGENVSATEVADAIAATPGVIEAVVYGVSVPGAEGRAGMAAIVTGPEFELGAFHRDLAGRLPEYARPLFLRLLAEIAVTGTFKPMKADFARGAYDPSATSDAIHFYDRARQAFVRLDDALYQRIQSRQVRF
jgi:fatty-acyl-CoA synthase